jgi:type IV pilus assembly protein PilC
VFDMPQFRYQALNAENQPVAGEILADNVAQAIGKLEAAGLTVQSIGYATGTPPRAVLPPINSDLPSLSAAEQAVLETRLLQIVERGRALAPALSAYAAEMPQSLSRQNLLDFVRVLQSGESAQAADALRRRPEWWIPLLASAAESSNHCQLLQAILREYRPSTELSERGQGSLVYPLVGATFVAAVFLFIGVFVVPVFRDLFEGFGLKLPWLTHAVLACYAIFTSGKVLVIAAAIGAFALVANRILKTVDADGIRPRFAPALRRSGTLAQFSRYVADLLNADMQSASALRLASSAVGKPSLKQAAWRVANKIEAGRDEISAADRRTVTNSVLYALRNDVPRAGQVAALREISRSHKERARSSLSWTREAVQPISILVVGILVGLTVVGLYLPLLKLIQALS